MDQTPMTPVHELRIRTKNGDAYSVVLISSNPGWVDCSMSRLAVGSEKMSSPYTPCASGHSALVTFTQTIRKLTSQLQQADPPDAIAVVENLSDTTLVRAQDQKMLLDMGVVVIFNDKPI